MKKYYLFAICWFLIKIGHAQVALPLNTGKLSIPSIDQFNPTSFWADYPAVLGHHYVLLQFAKPLTANQQQQLSNAGIELLDYIPPFTYNASFKNEVTKRQLQILGAIGIGTMPASKKLSMALQQPSKYRWIQGNNGRMDVLIKIASNVDITVAKSYLQQRGYTITPSPFEAYHIIQSHCLSLEIGTLAAIPFVTFIEPVHPADKTLNNKSRDMARNNIASATIAAGGYQLLGKGVTAGVGDDGDPTNHIDLQGHVINRNPFIYTDHGTHVTGTVGGAGIFRYPSRGYAPQATIISQLFGGIYLNAGSYVSDYGMVITNNSYGSITGEADYEGVYDIYSQILDEQAFLYPELLHVFASGNDGEVAVPPYTFNYGNVLSGYQSAKNVITVGRTDRTMYASGTSSSGPVRDGRLKPEMMALGEEIISPAANGNYASAWGTSQAAPAVTGGITLMVEQYKKQFGVNPKSGLMKCIAMNGAMDIGVAGPDFRHGYGMLNMERSLDMLQNNHFLQNSIATAGVYNQTIFVPANTAQLKVLLYWHDPAASLYAPHTLVNDLDLELVDGIGNITYPQKLDTLPNRVANLASTGADHINNSEQIVINNPGASYTVRVKGTAINVNPTQDFFVAYDYLPQGLHLSVPFEKDSYFPGDLCVVHWSDYGTPNNQRTLEYSLDNGMSWATIATNISDTARFYDWTIPTAETNMALLRLSENGTGFSSTSGKFVILAGAFHSYATTAQQCEGYCKINWNSISASADIDYEILMKQGPDMVSIGTTATTNFVVSGLNKDSAYWFSVRPRKAGIGGRRDNGSPYQPNIGSCSLGISDGDLKMDAILINSGRVGTSSALSASHTIGLRIKNLDDISITGFEVQYGINGSPLVSTVVGATIAAGGTYTHNITGVDFSQPGTYAIVAIVKNSAVDMNVLNDTLHTSIKQLKNPVINLLTPFIENFDGSPASEIINNRMGIDSLDSWDFSSSTANGRSRTFVNSGIATSGNRAMTIDVNKFTNTGNTNYLTGTFNLSSYNAATDEIRFDVQFKNHGTFQTPHADNKIYVRGSETDAWVALYDLDANQTIASGIWKKTASLDIAASLNNASPSQNFSSSTQIRFGQHALFSMGDNTHYAGYSFDDVRLYTVASDVEVRSVTSPTPNSCALTNSTPVTILIKNAMASSLALVPINMQIDNGVVITETIASLPPSAIGVPYTFTATANLAAAGAHTIKIWSSYASDNFKENDTITILINNLPVISNYPYLQDFESGNGNYYAQGLNSSWQFGIPNGIKIKKAASGQNAWKTNLEGWYNDEELSYLYTPCFDVSALTNPTLSFSMAYGIEYCGVNHCDGAWVEYSTDGISWAKLGSSSSGTNWYNNINGQVWDSTKTWWHVATTALPTGATNLRLRFVMSSDLFVGGDGIAIDDIHVYDKQYDIYDGSVNSNSVSQPVSGSTPIHFIDGGKILATITPNGNNLGSTAVQTYMYTGAIRNTSQLYYANRNITIKPTNTIPTTPVTIRYYFLDTEADSMRYAKTCGACTTPIDYTQLGIIKYDDVNDNIENGTMADNASSGYNFYNTSLVKKVPYGAGYYAEYEVLNFSEFWLSDGHSSIILPTEWVNFTAERIQNKDAQLQWTTANETNLIQYEVQRMQVGSGNNIFEKIGTVAATNLPGLNTYRFTDKQPEKLGGYYYRIKSTDYNGQVRYSETKLLLFGKKGASVLLYPNPVKNKLEVVLQSETATKISLSLYDVSGKLMLAQSQTATGSLQKIQINMTSFVSGTYQLHVKVDKIATVYKIVKE